MNTNELRQLDAWIAEHVMGLPPAFVVIKRGLYYRPDDKGYTPSMRDAGRYTLEQAKEREYPHDEPVTYAPWQPEHYTTDPAAAMMVLEKCVEKLGAFEHISINCCDGEFAIRMAHANWEWIQAPTLPLAICLFARKLFS